MPGTRSSRREQNRPTIREVAAAAGVSRQTVSNVVNAGERVAPATRSRVLEAIARLGYAPNEAARSLTSRDTRAIAVSIGRSEHDPGAVEYPFLQALVRAAGQRGIRILLVDRGDDAAGDVAALADVWNRRAADGVVLTETRLNDYRADQLVELGIPVAVFGTPWGRERVGHDWTDIDGAEGMRLGVEHLVDRGHRRIGFVGWQPDGAGGDVRAEGWSRAVRRSGLDPVLRVHAAEDSIDAGHAAAAELLRRDDRPSALSCASDSLAFGACQALTDAGLTPGVDVAVVGYDDSGIARIARPPISSLHQPLEEVAVLVLDALRRRAGTPDAEPLSRMLAPTLVVRSSSAAPAAPAARRERSGRPE